MTDTKRAAPTPGPWRFEPNPHRKKGEKVFFDKTEVHSSDGRFICALWAMDIAHQQANARLIAAAPDLLEAAAGILRYGTAKRQMWNAYTQAAEALRAAIAKAEGSEEGGGDESHEASSFDSGAMAF